MEKSSTEDPPCLTGAWEAGSLVPSRSEMRARRRATCFSCSSSWRRCSSTFSWAMRCGRCVIELDLTRRRAGAYKVGEGVAVLFAADGVHRLGVVHWRVERGVDGTMIGVGPVPSVPCVSGASCSFLSFTTLLNTSIVLENGLHFDRTTCVLPLPWVFKPDLGSIRVLPAVELAQC